MLGLFHYTFITKASGDENQVLDGTDVNSLPFRGESDKSTLNWEGIFFALVSINNESKWIK